MCGRILFSFKFNFLFKYLVVTLTIFKLCEHLFSIQNPCFYEIGMFIVNVRVVSEVSFCMICDSIFLYF